jgi:uncharacterized membrane protein YphA (DoxX/SURF4 family)
MQYNKTIHWILRVIIAALFIISGISKLFPISAFEKQLVDLGITNWCFAPLFARGLIVFELFLGLSFLQNHFFKKLILPATASMLVIFTLHLSWQIITAGNSGNCGCMGQLLPMTPLQAIIKNIVSLIILAVLYVKTPSRQNNLHRYPFLILVISTVPVLLFFPATCCCDKAAAPKPIEYETPVVDTLNADTITESTATEVKPATKDSVAVKQIPKLKGVVSEFADYRNFSGGKAVNLDEGKKIVCVFNTTCDHCMDIAKKITAAGKKAKLPPIYVLFWSEGNAEGADLEKEIAAFFKFAGSSHPYLMVDVATFFRKLGKHSGPPRIAILNEGNIMGDFGPDTYEEKAFLKVCK